MERSDHSGSAGWRAWRHRALTIGLLVIVLLRPLVAFSYRTTLAADVLSAGFLLGFVGISRGRRAVLGGGALLTLGILFAAAFIYTWEAVPHWGRIALVAADCLLTASFIIYVCIVILRDVMRGPEVTVDSVFGAICVYMLSGTVWASLYLLIHLVNPVAFAGLHTEGVEPASPAAVYGHARTLDYFSFATLTSLGYGDIVPKSHMARTLAWMEAAAGQLYIAVMVARLVALETARLIQRQEQRESSSDDPKAGP